MPNAHDTSRHSRLLVVDDDASQLRTLTGTLQDEGFDVVGCSTGAEALEYLSGDGISAAVVDLRLPDLSAIELLAKLEELGKPVPVIIHTAYGTLESAKQAINLGAFAFVEKGTEYNELIRHVHRAFRIHLEQHAARLEDSVAERSRELRENETKYRDLIELAPDAVITLDWWGRVTSCNRMAELMTGYSADEWLGQRFTKVGCLSPRDVPKYIRIFCSIMRGRIPETVEVSLTKGDGARMIGEAHVGPIRENDRIVGVQAVLRDVTERKRAEAVAAIPRDLALALSGTTELDEGLGLSVVAALRISDMDCGGVYLHSA